MYQLWVENEYGQRGIIGSSEDLNALIKDAKKEVSYENMENALTEDDKKKNWTAYFVEICDKNGNNIDNAFYSGKKANTHKVCLVKKGNVEEYNLEEKDVTVRCYIGQIRRDKTGQDIDIFWANTPKGKLITDVNNQDLKQKTIYFIRKI